MQTILAHGAPPHSDTDTRWAAAESYNAKGKNIPERLLCIGMLGDALVIFGSLILTFFLRFDTSIVDLGGMAHPVTIWDYTGYIMMGCFSLICAFAYFHIYDVQKLLRLRSVVVLVTKAVVIWFLAFLSFTLIFKFQPPISRLYVTLSAVVVLANVLGWRFAFHRTLQRSGYAQLVRQKILFVGWNEESARLSTLMKLEPYGSHEVIGCVLGSSEAWPPPSVPVLGGYGQMADSLRDHEVDIVILADLALDKEEIVAVANLCEKELKQFKVIPSYFQILVSGLHLETISSVPVLGVSQLPLDHLHNRMIKRAIDIAGALVGIFISVPLIAVFGALVYFESKGTVLYRQRRMGKSGMPFDILKIRSMKLDAENGGRPGWTQKNDPRRLRIGAFMRAWNIDELPQFWNVLKGEMSLVGPRPERPELISNFKSEIPHYNARHNVKPGITGWAQVKGLRGDTDLRERINCDLFYLENWNLFLDFQIMVMTFFTRQNAC